MCVHVRMCEGREERAKTDNKGDNYLCATVAWMHYKCTIDLISEESEFVIKRLLEKPVRKFRETENKSLSLGKQIQGSSVFCFSLITYLQCYSWVWAPYKLKTNLVFPYNLTVNILHHGNCKKIPCGMMLTFLSFFFSKMYCPDIYIHT